MSRRTLAPRVLAGLMPSLRHIGHRQIRSRTTIGGSIAHADPAAELPALLCALDGSVVVRSAARGERIVAAADFLTGPLMTDRRDDEVVVEVRFPAYPGRLQVAEVAKRPGDFAIVGCVAGYAVEDGLMRDPRVVVFGASATAVRISAAETALLGAEPRPSTFAAAAEAVRDTLDPEGDIHASAEYRRHVAGTLVERALAGAA